MKRSKTRITIALAMGITTSLLYQITAHAHCDTLDGPVIAEARAALQRGDATPILKWVKQEHEAEVRKSFTETMAVRIKGDEVRAFADRYFFETLVRLHRAGEGEAYTGLKPAGKVEPVIAAADKALVAGSVDSLAKSISGEVREGIRKRFAAAHEKKKGANKSIRAGREYVEAYVEYVHFVERIHDLIVEGAPHTHKEAGRTR
jgi:uncharacterized protein DUF6448